MWTATKEKLPPVGIYVLGRYNGGNWNDSDDQHNVNCVVVKLKMGLSAEDRQKMKDGLLPDPESEGGWCLADGYTTSKRSNTYKAEDQHSNNHVPYSWTTFGPSDFFGQEIEYWQEIEPLPGFDPKYEIYVNPEFLKESEEFFSKMRSDMLKAFIETNTDGKIIKP